jgi:protease-4
MNEQDQPGNASTPIGSGRPLLGPPQVPPPPPPPGYGPMLFAPPPKRGGGVLARVGTALISTILIASIVLNVYLAILVASFTRGVHEQVYQAGDAKQRIVVLPIKGLIDDETFSQVRQSLDALKKNLPKAMILRVDSSGGYVSPSDRIWHALCEFKQETGIPIVASFGSVAASGGYYVATPADHIIAEPTTITGSIGVIAQAFTFQELLTKVGVKPEVIPSTQSTKKDVLNPLRDWTENDRVKIRLVLDHAYEQFVAVVVQGRKAVLSEAQVRELANGDVYTVDQAIENKLVDEKGYLDAAITKAATLAGLPTGAPPHVTVVTPPQKISLMNLMAQTHDPRGAGVDLNQAAGSLQQLDPAAVTDFLRQAAAPRIMFRETSLGD